MFKLILFIFLIANISCDKSFMINDNYVCGKSRNRLRKTRVIGGSSALFGQVPWQALIQVKRDSGVHQCGAVLIDDHWVLTAAHCVDNSNRHIQEIKVFLGKHCLKEFAGLDDIRTLYDVSNDPETNEWDYRFTTRHALRVVINEEFNCKTLDNDIAMIRLNQSIIFDHNIAPICLPKPSEDFCLQTGYISGFGIVDYESKRVPHVLQITSVPILTKDHCNYLFERLGHKNVMRRGRLCAGYLDGGKDACIGDSGGPLAVKRSADNKWVLAGIISSGIKCGQPLVPGIYTEVSQFVNWIEFVINSDRNRPIIL